MQAASTDRRQPADLPTFYYHAHFVEFLQFIRRHYRHCLADQHLRFINEFESLDRDAQCLFVRLANRKGRLFAVRRLSYPEIGDLHQPLSELREMQWLASPDSRHYADILRYLTREKLLGALRKSIIGMPRSLSKRELVEFAETHLPPGRFLSNTDIGGLVVMQRWSELSYLLFLYFGHIEESLTQFTMRDLGIVKTQVLTDEYVARFDDIDEAEENYYFAMRLHQLKKGSVPANELLAEIRSWQEPRHSNSAILRDRLSYRLGRHFESEKEVAKAQAAYRSGESAKCSERLVRTLFAAGDRQAARRFLESCLENPRSDAEAAFAIDVYEQKFQQKRTSKLTDMLRESQVIDIDESRSGSTEDAAVEYYISIGQMAYRTENTIWRTLFGLLFWDELFGGDSPALHSPFELLPSSLLDRSFYSKHEAAIEKKLFTMADRKLTKHCILKASTQNFGKQNRLVQWRQDVTEPIFALLDAVNPLLLAPSLRRMCHDYASNSHGFPDLLIIDNQAAKFVEIKAEGDQLRRSQMLRIEQLRADGLDTELVRIRWILDPEQVYVVVDIETTGGMGEAHRITEIGALKIKNGQIIDRFETLLNPQRAVPRNITRLTGITSEMVADAPFFADIVDDFEAFLGNAIFVAHNVNFDYRFIAQEFARLGRPFRHARLCTCSSMRKLYPGHKSYSLGNLCRTFDIPLKSHHRAMCDAEAAAELLVMVNDRRLELISSTNS